jgi:hypothetical protein
MNERLMVAVTRRVEAASRIHDTRNFFQFCWKTSAGRLSEAEWVTMFSMFSSDESSRTDAVDDTGEVSGSDFSPGINGLVEASISSSSLVIIEDSFALEGAAMAV